MPAPQHSCAPPPLAGLNGGGQISGLWNLEEEWKSMAMSEAQQREVYVKVAAVLMVVLVAYGALALVGVVR
jgi:hypothetical protein